MKTAIILLSVWLYLPEHYNSELGYYNYRILKLEDEKYETYAECEKELNYLKNINWNNENLMPGIKFRGHCKESE